MPSRILAFMHSRIVRLKQYEIMVTFLIYRLFEREQFTIFEPLWQIGIKTLIF